MTLYEILDTLGDSLNPLYKDTTIRNGSFFKSEISNPELLKTLDLNDAQNLIGAILRELTFRISNFNQSGLQGYQFGLICKSLSTKRLDFRGLPQIETFAQAINELVEQNGMGTKVTIAELPFLLNFLSRYRFNLTDNAADKLGVYIKTQF